MSRPLSSRQGFEQGQIDALLHQMELSIKHQDANFGLKIILVRTEIVVRSLLSFTHMCAHLGFDLLVDPWLRSYR